MIFAEDIAMARVKEYRSWCTQYAIPHVTLFTKEELGRIIGKPSRSAVGLISPHFFELLRVRLASLESFQTASHKV
jgi:ribosomal protein L7Ae-like RNA K-turn-binding protein